MPGFRDALIETAVALNAAQAAFALRQEVEAAGRWEIEVLYGVYNLFNHQVTMPNDPFAPPSDDECAPGACAHEPARVQHPGPQDGRDSQTAPDEHEASRIGGEGDRGPVPVVLRRVRRPARARGPLTSRGDQASRIRDGRPRSVIGVEQSIFSLPKPRTGLDSSPQASEPPGPVSYWGPPLDMHAITSSEDTLIEPAKHERDRNHLKEVIDHAGHLLPAQGPITVFIHHNTLHAFEDLPFNAAVKKGGHIFGCQPYLSEDRYRQELSRGPDPVRRVEGGAANTIWEAGRERRSPASARGWSCVWPCSSTRLRTGPTEELVWYVAEANALRRIRQEVSAADRARLIAETRRWVIRDLRGFGEPSRNGASKPEGDRRIPDSLAELLDRFGESRMEYWSDADWEGLTLQALWRVCCDGVRDMPAVHHTGAAGHPAPGHAAGGDRRGHRLAGQRSADPVSAPRSSIRDSPAGSCPGVTRGSTAPFAALYRPPWGPPSRWMRGLAEEVGRLLDEGIGPLESILESLRILGVAAEEWDRFLAATLLALRGWSGMVRQIEIRGDRVVHPVPEGSLVEFLAIRLLLDRFALAYTARSSLGIRDSRARVLASCTGVGRSALATQRRAAGLPGLPARPDLRSVPRCPLPPEQAAMEDDPPGDRVVHRARAAAGLSPRLRAAVLHSDRRRGRLARPPPGSDTKPARGFRRSSASTSARSRSAATWRSWRPTR